MSLTTTTRTAAETVPVQEAVMGQPFPTQHPAVVLRSNFNLVRGLLAVAMAAVVALSAAVVIVANNDDELAGSSSAGSAATLPNQAVHSHPLEGTPAPATRYDGGPEEGTRSIIVVPQAPDARYDGGPDEGTRSLGSTATSPVPERTTDSASAQDSQSVPIPQGPLGNR
jgi:hypothetical protein